ncbi:MAG: ATP-dependent Clp protease ATP-binding subunit [Parcubacteria group bacterium]|nr:ATP-dependent Clp protease ATP-binding subunit [Parcubacteria group bacterium]
MARNRTKLKIDKDLIKLDPNVLCEQTKELEDFLLERIVNQPRAVKCVVSAFDQFNSPLRQHEKPILSALFLGPSGVGKTYIAEMLAEYLFDNPAAFTKIECANYAERHEITKLLGAPTGYIGYDHPTDPRYYNPSLLAQEKIDMPAIQHAQMTFIKTDKEAQRLNKEMENSRQKCLKLTNQQEAKTLMQIYRQKVIQFQNYVVEKTKNIPPISIILFDEIEKAHSSLHHFLLEITSKGRTRLGNGEETFFHNSFIIMTSNAGSRSIAEIVKGKKEIGFVREKTAKSSDNPIDDRAMLELKKLFTTEFLGRIEKNIVVFKNLSNDDIKKIIDIQLNELLVFLARSFPFELIISDEVKGFILENASDHPEYGARLVSDKIDKYIKEPLARMINTDQIVEGSSIFANLENGNIVFLKASNLLSFSQKLKNPAK